MPREVVLMGDRVDDQKHREAVGCLEQMEQGTVAELVQDLRKKDPDAVDKALRNDSAERKKSSKRPSNAT